MEDKTQVERYNEFIRRKISINEDDTNNDISNYHDDEDHLIYEDDITSKALVSTENKETITAEVIENEITPFQQRISEINQNSQLAWYQNQQITYNHHLDQVNKNQLKIQRAYDSNISIYQNQKSIDEYKENDKKEDFSRIEIQSENLLSKINENKNNLRLWRYKDKYYCRVSKGIIVDNVDDGVTIKEIEKNFKESIKIVEVNELITPKTQNITQSKIHQFILLNHIPVVSDIVFNPKEDEFFEEDGVLYQNTFKHTKYLKRRLVDKFGVLDFNKLLEKNKTSAILNWLSYYFINMKSSGTALLLDGNKELSQNLFWNKIIQPIFGYEYSITIDDEILKHKVEEIVHEKVFYHIGDFEPTKENILKVNQLLQAVLIDKSLVINGLKPKEIPIYGQVLITSKESASLLKKYTKQFEYINIQDEDSSIFALELLTDNYLDKFVTLLSLFYEKSEAPSIINSIDLLEKEDDQNKLENFDVKIEEFISAFKTQDIEYFDKVKELDDGKLFNELKDALLKGKGFFIKQDLSKWNGNLI